MAFEKALKTLEYNKILDMLASYAHTQGGKGRALALTPSGDADSVKRMLNETTDALKYLNFKGLPSFGNVSDVSFSVDNARKGASLPPVALLDIANVLRTSRGLIE